MVAAARVRLAVVFVGAARGGAGWLVLYNGRTFVCFPVLPGATGARTTRRGGGGGWNGRREYAVEMGGEAGGGWEGQQVGYGGVGKTGAGILG